MLNRVIALSIVFLCVLMHIDGQLSFSWEEAIEYAVENSNVYASSELDVENADAIVQEYKSIGKPTLSASVAYNYYYIRPKQVLEDFVSPAVAGYLSSIPGFTDEFPLPPITSTTSEVSFIRKNSLSGQLDFSTLLFDVSYIEGLKAARLSKDIQADVLGITRRDIAKNIARTYINILLIENNIDIVSQNIEVIEQILSETKNIYEAGFAEQLDVDKLEVSREELLNQINQLEEAEALSRNALKYQMTIDLNEEIILEDQLQPLVDRLAIGKVEGEQEFIDFDNLPETVVFEKTIRLDEIDIRRLSKNLPQVRFLANINTSLQRDRLFDSSESGFLPGGAVGLGITYDIIDGGLRTAQKRQSIVRKEKKQLEFEEFKRAVQLEVKNAQIGINTARNRLNTSQKRVDLNEKIFNTTQIKFKEGVGSSLEIEQAKQELYLAQNDYVQALFDLLESYVDLQIALGYIK